jgi:signal transduction histidine kinase
MPLAEFAKGVLVNLFVLLAFVALCGTASGWSTRHRHVVRSWHIGLLFGILAVVAMLFPVVTQPGFIFDSRSGVLGAAGLIGGPLTALAALPLPLAYRLHIGGDGMFPGILEIVLPALLGSLFHSWFQRRGDELTVPRVLVASIAVGVLANIPIVSLIVVLMPENTGLIGPGGIALVVLNTCVSMGLLGTLIVVEKDHYAAIESQRDSDSRVRQSQKMAAIGQFAGSVAHSFTNSMTSILANAQMAKDKAGEKERVQAMMEDVIETIGRTSRLTGELLAFAHPSPVRMRSMELGRCFAGIKGILAKTVGDHVELVINTGRNTGQVNVDCDQIGQAVVHMAVNADEAMPAGGRLIISAARANLSDKETKSLQAARHEKDRHDGGFAVLSVADTGTGMSEETLSHIFEPFFTTKREKGNVGLGLTTVYGIVERHNGHIDVQSRPGGGSTFLIYLPIVEE